MELLFHLQQFRERRQGNLHNRRARRCLRYLFQVDNPRPAHALNHPAVRLGIPHDQTEQGGLARAVAANQGNALPLLDAQVHLGENRFSRE